MRFNSKTLRTMYAFIRTLWYCIVSVTGIRLAGSNYSAQKRAEIVDKYMFINFWQIWNDAFPLLRGTCVYTSLQRLAATADGSRKLAFRHIKKHPTRASAAHLRPAKRNLTRAGPYKLRDDRGCWLARHKVPRYKHTNSRTYSVLLRHKILYPCITPPRVDCME